MNNKWTSMNKIAVRVSYGVYILALLFVVVMLFFDQIPIRTICYWCTGGTYTIYNKPYNVGNVC